MSFFDNSQFKKKNEENLWSVNFCFQTPTVNVPTAGPYFKPFRKKILWEKFLLRMTRNKFGPFSQHFPV